MDSFDVAIIGGGIIGASIAFELASENLRVVILDRQQPGREASWAAAGMLSAAPHSPRDIPLVPFSSASLAMYPAFVDVVEEASGKKTNYRRAGSFELFSAWEGASERDRAVAQYRELGLTAESFPIEDARAIEPCIGSCAGAASWLLDEATVEPRLLVQAVLSAAYSQGVEVHANCAVTSLLFESSNGGSRFGVAGGDTRCVGIIANGEKIRAARVILAAGCFCGTIAEETSNVRSLFVPDNQALTAAVLSRYAPVTPVRGQMIALLPQKPTLQHTLRSRRGYIVPRLDGRVVVGSTIEHTGFEKRVTAEGMRKLIDVAVELVPDLAQAEIVETWSGLRPGTPDDLPIIGPCEIEGLFVATGHYRNGILLAPITAQIAKDWILQRKSTNNPVLLPSRFAALNAQEQSAS